MPWAVSYPEGNLNDAPTFPVHPSQLYDSLLSLILYFGLAWLYRRKKFNGQGDMAMLGCFQQNKVRLSRFIGSDGTAVPPSTKTVDNPRKKKVSGTDFTDRNRFRTPLFLPFSLFLSSTGN